ncbi:MAG: PBP1A family penicillin-binding protein [Rhodobacteraceae bacterium]|nr:MAG: PBP1A family penicillin-binding protein [Paracoccaceae bacterium]
MSAAARYEWVNAPRTIRPERPDRRERVARRKGEKPGRKPGPKPVRAPADGQSWLDRAIRAVVLALVGLTLRVALGVGLIVAAAVGVAYSQLPPVDQLLDGRDRGSVTMLDRKGDVFAWRGEQFGGAIRPGDVSPHLIDAILAAEDRRFFHHPGIDIRGLIRAAVVNLGAGRVVQGGSTITQQVAKNVFLDDSRSIDRKLREIPLALAMELKYDKDDILALYLNRVFLGAGAYGFEAASQRYFGKSAKFLTIPEAAMLAGLLKAPSRFAPTRDVASAQARADVVLTAMAATGRITPEHLARARAEPATLSAAAAARAGGHFADWVMEAGPVYLTRATREDVVIRTTFDPAAQRAAEAAVRAVFENRVRPDSKAQAAVVVMSPDGAVRAVVGGRDPREGAFNRATQALRQTGSLFKTFVYAAALERGAQPHEVIRDAPLTIGRWSPRNFGGEFAGPVTLTEAFARSINTVAVRLNERTGRERARAMARKLGVTSPIADGAAMALGVSEATLIEMTGAYAAFASGGLDGAPWAIREIRVRGAAEPLMTGGGPRRRVLDDRIAGEMTWMMGEVVRNGTGRRAAPAGRPVAGKTGTTQAARDAWFIGFTADWVVGVWMGNDDNTPLVGVTGGGLPAEIFRETVERLEAGSPPRPLPERRPAAPARPAGPAVATADDDTLLGAIVNDVARRLGAREPVRLRIEYDYEKND